jgi:hypothetical protein
MTLRPLPHDNRRAAPRKAFNQAATVAYGDVTRPVRTSDLGRDGLCLLAPKPIAPGTRCKVSFDIPLSDGVVQVTMSAKVVYSSYSAVQEFKIGAVFIDLDEATAAVLRKFETTY